MIFVAGWLLVPFNVRAQSGGGFEIKNWGANSGGGISTGGAFWLVGTLGQEEAGETQVGGAFELTGGLWHGDPAGPTGIHLKSFEATQPFSPVMLLLGSLLFLLGFLLVRRRFGA